MQCSDHRAQLTLLEVDLCSFVEGTESEGQGGEPRITGADAGRRHYLGPAQNGRRGFLFQPHRLCPGSVSASLPDNIFILNPKRRGKANFR